MVYQNNRQNVIVKGFGNSFMNSANIRNHIQHKQILNANNKNYKQINQNNLKQLSTAFNELCSMYDAVNYFGKSEYFKKSSWRSINKHQLNTATIYAIRYAPVVPKRSLKKQRSQPRRPNSKQHMRPQQRPQSKQQKRQNMKGTNKGVRIGGCKYKPNVPRVYNYNTAPLPTSLYPVAKNYNHLFDAFNYFGRPQIRNIQSWIESSRTHKLNSIASVFAKRNAPFVPVRQNNKKNQKHGQKRRQMNKNIQKQQMKIIPKQQSNVKQPKNIKSSNVWEHYYDSPTRRMFK